MDGCHYQMAQALKPAGHDYLIGTASASRMFRAYFPEAHSTLDEDEFVEFATGAMPRTNRFEAYLFDLASSSGEPMAALILAAEEDIHRGGVAVPMVCYIHPQYRNNRRVTKWLADKQRHGGRMLNCSWLMRMKHLNDNTRLITYKEL